MTTEFEIVKVENISRCSASPDQNSTGVSNCNDNNSESYKACGKTSCEEDNTTPTPLGSGNCASVTPFSITDILTRMENKEVGHLSQSNASEDSIYDSQSDYDSLTIASLKNRQELSVSLSNIKVINSLVSHQFSNISPMDLSKETNSNCDSSSSPRKKYNCVDEKISNLNNNHLNNNDNLLSNFMINNNSIINSNCNGKSMLSKSVGKLSTSVTYSGASGVNIKDLSSLTQQSLNHSHHHKLLLTPTNCGMKTSLFIEQRLQQARLEALGLANNFGLSIQPYKTSGSAPSSQMKNNQCSSYNSNLEPVLTTRELADSSSTTIISNKVTVPESRLPKLLNHSMLSSSSTVISQMDDDNISSSGARRRSLSPPSSTGSLEEMDPSDREDEDGCDAKRNLCESTSADPGREADDRGQECVCLSVVSVRCHKDIPYFNLNINFNVL